MDQKRAEAILDFTKAIQAAQAAGLSKLELRRLIEAVYLTEGIR